MSHGVRHGCASAGRPQDDAARPAGLLVASLVAGTLTSRRKPRLRCAGTRAGAKSTVGPRSVRRCADVVSTL
ncbi:conserved hypothetical protein [Burkholderia multivorans CGD1]|nr:conserved hypothetical protein [Burkholderia multivorans CGD1]